MSALTKQSETVFAADVWFDDSKLHAYLTDGREIRVPIDWYPRLYDALEAARNDRLLTGRCQGIHWEVIDEYLSVAGFLKV